MSGGENIKWGKKGFFLGVFAVAIILFFCLLIYVYGHPSNQVG